jgi:DNA-binding Xre family transcriptional regulator
MFINLYKEMAAHNRMSAAELARRLGLSQKSISYKLNGKTEFTRAEMVKIKNIFGGKSLDELFEDVPKPDV